MEELHLTKEEAEKMFGKKLEEMTNDAILTGKTDNNFGPPNPDEIYFYPEFLELFRKYGCKIVKDPKDGLYRVYYRDDTGDLKNDVTDGLLVFDSFHESKFYTKLLKHAMRNQK